ncbi:hypothetical protein EX30DRAFT_130264 [Ascodesmis nigricans]|uniref:Uncharacterized protein n=1 Tax=Ascodesmis nigricans TaxID=341454 RepID=A0A4S2MRN7_9PEZI|nr:hypothetical protein EX30DRAFT_130264 [Ascodesmis nigricans]
MNSLGISPVSHRPPPFKFPTPPGSSSASDIQPGLASPRFIASAQQACPPANLLEEHFIRQTPPASPPRRNGPPLGTNGAPLDSMSLHLLVETAIYDSAEYEVLPFEQLESLKKEYANLITRIDNAKRKLQMESKLRDAAISLQRLYSGKKATRRSSLLGGGAKNRDSHDGGDQVKSTEAELLESTRKCEDISRELWRLNNRAIEVQKRLLQHSAAVLGHAQAVAQHDAVKEDGEFGSWDDRSAYRTPGDLMGGFGARGGVDEATMDRVQDLVDAFTAALGKRPKLQASSMKGDLNDLISEMEQGVEYLRAHPPGGNPRAEREFEEAETTMRSLWDMLTLDDEQDTQSDDEDFDSHMRSFSITNFSRKVQSLLARHQEAISTVSHQREEVETVMHQLEQTRSKDHRKTLESSAELTAAITAKESAEDALKAIEQTLETVQDALETAQTQAERERRARELAEQQADALLADKAAAIEENQLLREARDALEGQLDAVINETDSRLRQLESEISNIKAAKQNSDNSNSSLQNQLTEAQSELEHANDELEKANEELEQMAQKLAEVSTELVMAKADLDAAYGSKSQRAAETAEARAAAEALAKASKQPQTIDPGLLAEIDSLATRNRQLEKELKELLHDFEEVTKQGVEMERERSKVEGLIDALRERVEELEVALGEEKIRTLGGRQGSVLSLSDGQDGRSPSGRPLRGTVDSTSMSVLKQEFKKMMRDMRAEQQKALRAEHEERRRLEALIRKMKKDQMQAKRATGASDSTTATTNNTNMTAQNSPLVGS